MSTLSMRSSLVGQSLAFKPAGVASVRPARVAVVSVDAKKVCDLTGKKRNKANAVCFSNKKSRKWQEPNLQQKKVGDGGAKKEQGGGVSSPHSLCGLHAGRSFKGLQQ